MTGATWQDSDFSPTLAKDISPEIPLDFWGSGRTAQVHVWVPHISCLFLGCGFSLIAHLLLPWYQNHAPSSWLAVVWSVVPIPSGWPWLGVWKR